MENVKEMIRRINKETEGGWELSCDGKRFSLSGRKDGSWSRFTYETELDVKKGLWVLCFHDKVLRLVGQIPGAKVVIYEKEVQLDESPKVISMIAFNSCYLVQDTDEMIGMLQDKIEKKKEKIKKELEALTSVIEVVESLTIIKSIPYTKMLRQETLKAFKLMKRKLEKQLEKMEGINA